MEVVKESGVERKDSSSAEALTMLSPDKVNLSKFRNQVNKLRGDKKFFQGLIEATNYYVGILSDKKEGYAIKVNSRGHTNRPHKGDDLEF
ncbi:hypothetical protein BIY24_08140 [Halobacteriovorax marinus]|uniref:hypothetical protein n=1 Tax=Halobacteriovorax marinus TaxID=97084 RepID=UPI000BC34192|nr:hypothetical protein [Halobacteriovorax marinus]ATH07920.1 hypothetical protein BIY24_08140 [Halobacteriovorax marinus]